MMKKLLTQITLIFLFITCFQQGYAQQTGNAGAYMTQISENHRDITKDFLSYTSAVAHNKSARKIENRRQKMMQTIQDAIKNIRNLKPYGEDASLRDSAVSYLKMTYIILNEDYGKIMDLEDVAEQSYDAMEAYMLAQEIANEKIKEAQENLNLTEKAFAASHNVNLIESSDDKLSQKMEQTGKVNRYHREIYLIFFKSYKQELYLLDAINEKNINAIEQNKNALLKYAQEGIDKIVKLQAFNADNSLLIACKQLLEFHRDECNKMSNITDYFIKDEEFHKLKKAFESKKASDRTKEDVAKYNKAIEDLNKAVNVFNTTNNDLNNKRSKLIGNWNKASQNFLAKHTPKSR
ncbi:MAG: hypothetical protein ACK4ND_13255 [Cytophagaceae bacterium]